MASPILNLTDALLDALEADNVLSARALCDELAAVARDAGSGSVLHAALSLSPQLRHVPACSRAQRDYCVALLAYEVEATLPLLH